MTGPRLPSVPYPYAGVNPTSLTGRHTTMNETTERTRQTAAAPTAEHTDHGAWQTPGYTVVDTALEVTAYSLAAR